MRKYVQIGEVKICNTTELDLFFKTDEGVEYLFPKSENPISIEYEKEFIRTLGGAEVNKVITLRERNIPTPEEGVVFIVDKKIAREFTHRNDFITALTDYELSDKSKVSMERIYLMVFYSDEVPELLLSEKLPVNELTEHRYQNDEDRKPKRISLEEIENKTKCFELDGYRIYNTTKYTSYINTRDVEKQIDTWKLTFLNIQVAHEPIGKFNGLPVVRHGGYIDNIALPEETPGVLYLVSDLIAYAFKYRSDIITVVPTRSRMLPDESVLVSEFITYGDGLNGLSDL